MFNRETFPCTLEIPCSVRTEDFEDWSGTITTRISRGRNERGDQALVLEVTIINVRQPDGTGRAQRRPSGRPPIAYPAEAASSQSIDAIGDMVLDLDPVPGTTNRRTEQVIATFTIYQHEQSYSAEMSFDFEGEPFPHA